MFGHSISHDGDAIWPSPEGLHQLTQDCLALGFGWHDRLTRPSEARAQLIELNMMTLSLSAAAWRGLLGAHAG